MCGFEYLLKQTEPEESGEVPKLEDRQRVVHFQCVHECGECHLREFAFCDSKVCGGNGGDARFVLAIGQDHTREFSHILGFA